MGMPTQSIFERTESNVRTYSRSYPATFDRALGANLWDTDGKCYLDFLSGCGSLNYGHNNPILKNALLKYIEDDSIAHAMDMQTRAKAEFLNAMNECILAPRNLDYVIQFTGPTGTNAVEAALKIARKVTGRTNILGFTNGFHGMSLGALAITGNAYHRSAAGVPLTNATVAPYDGYLGDTVDSISLLDKMLTDPSSGLDNPAGIIVEAVQGEGGLNTARLEWLRQLQALCHEHSILLIVDEIQAGCGRTGTFFSFEAAGIQPDLVPMAKSLSGFGLPMAALLIRRELDAWEPGEHNGTFRGNNHAFVTAAAALRHYWSDGKFEAQVVETGKHLEQCLQEIAAQFEPHIRRVVGRGMMRGLQMANPKAAEQICDGAFRAGLILERCGPRDEVLKMLMPLTITAVQLDEGLSILKGELANELGGLDKSSDSTATQAQTL